jgi:hypothetical protein
VVHMTFARRHLCLPSSTLVSAVTARGADMDCKVAEAMTVPRLEIVPRVPPETVVRMTF